MSKKIISIVLALLMLITAAVADVVDDTAVPSSGIPSITIVDIACVDGSDLPEGFVLYIEEEENTAQSVLDLFEEVKEFLAEGTISEYLGEEFVTAAAEYLPEETDASALVVDEFVQVVSSGYEEEMGDVEVTFTFLTAYEEGTVLLCGVGIIGEEGVAWTPLKAEVVEEGNVKITFTKDLLIPLQDAEAALTLLRAE